MSTKLAPCADPLRILLVDDFDLIRATLRSLLNRFSMFTVVGEARDGLSAVELALSLVPEVVTMDVKMPRLGGVEATRRIKAALPHTHVICLTSHDDQGIQEAMAEAGSSAFIPKECAYTLPHVIAQLTGRAVDPSNVGKDTF